MRRLLFLTVLVSLALTGSAEGGQLRGAMLTPNWSAQGSRFEMTPAQQRGEIAAVAQMGGNVVRLHVDWAALQPDGEVDPAYQAQLDQAVADASQYGQAVILNIIGTPCWAALAPDCPTTSKNHMAPPRPTQFAEVTRYLLARYPSLYGYEVWNEPNLAGGGFWTGSVADFAAIANAAVEGRNAIASHTRVIVGGLVDGGGDYLEQLYQAGMHGQDGISVHPYSAIPWFGWTSPSPKNSPFQQKIRLAHRIMLRHGDHGGLYVTEFGFATCPATSCVPDLTAAAFLAQSFRVASRYRYVKALTVFSMTDYAAPSDAKPSWIDRSGILGKPAFGQVHRALKQLRSKKYLKRLHRKKN
jgi:cellulase (glycosyl hydrolase family 5)